MQSYRWVGSFGCLFILFFLVAPVYPAQKGTPLPAESELPGRRTEKEVRPIVVDPPPPAKPNLPSESTLPVSTPVVRPADKDSEQDPDQEPTQDPDERPGQDPDNDPTLDQD